MRNVSILQWTRKLLLLLGSLVLLTAASQALQASLADENLYCQKGDVPTFGDKDGPAELPKTCYYTARDGTPSPGKQIKVAAGTDLSATLAQVACGDIVRLAAGSIFQVNEFPAKHCDDKHYITVRTDAPDSKLPAEDSRISPAWAGVASMPGRPPYKQPDGGATKFMATIQVTTEGGITFGDHYRFIGIEWAPAPGKKIARLLFLAGTDHVIFDRNWIHGVDGEELGHGLGLNRGATYIGIIHSYFNSFTCMARTGTCTDATAIGGGNGDDPTHTLKIVDNYLESSGENILFGGAAASVRPEDIEVRRNYFFKPTFWNPNSPDHRDPTPIVKNLFELKNANRVLLEANYLENSWGGFSQVGPAIVLTPRNTADKRLGIVRCPACAVTNITIRYNWVRKVNQVLQIANVKDIGAPAAGNSYSIHDLVAEGLGYPECGKACGGALNQIAGGPGGTPSESVLHDLTVSHITLASMTNAKDILILGGPPATGPGSLQMSNIAWTNNIGEAGEFGVWSLGGPPEINCSNIPSPSPKARLEACWGKSGVFKGNVLAGGMAIRGQSNTWPDGNYFPDNPESIGYVKLNGGIDGDYHLAAGSKFKGKATDGRDPGADVDAVLKAIDGVR